MKFRTTQKAIKKGFPYVVRVGYCDLQTMLNYRSPVAYTVRAEGWGADVYDLGGGVAVATGYVPFGNIRLPYDVTREFEKRAEQIMCAGDYESRREALEALIAEYVARVRGE